MIVDKPDITNLKFMWGCMIWRPKFTEFLHNCVSTLGEADFAQVMNDALRAGYIMRGVKIEDGNYIDLGTYEEIMEIDRRLRD
jgi:glucose-1-phosphate thymidylyltransferase